MSHADARIVSTPEIVGVGVSTLDVLMRVEEFPEGEVVTRALDSVEDGGGPVATALAAASRLGARAAMLDRLGDDARAARIREAFTRCGVDTQWIRETPRRSSSLATVLVRRRDGARSIVYAPGDCDALQPEDLPAEAIRQARVLHLNGRHPDACRAAIAIARDAGVLVSFDGGAHRYGPAARAFVSASDVCIVAREFAVRFASDGASSSDGSPSSAALSDASVRAEGADPSTAGDPPDRLLAPLHAAGPRIVVVTDGARGSWISGPNAPPFHQPALPADPLVDTTGCGDAFHGAFLFALVRGRSLAEAAWLAAAVAARVATRLGGRGGLPTLEELGRVFSS